MMLLDRHAERRLPELVAAAAALIDRAGLSADDERVARHPDARVVRYYQSLGLVDRPSRYEGRAAIYGWPHLVQVVAIKLLQSQGYPLSRVQESFTGLPFAQLEAAVLEAVGQRPPAAPVLHPPAQLSRGAAHSYPAGALIELPFAAQAPSPATPSAWPGAPSASPADLAAPAATAAPSPSPADLARPAPRPLLAVELQPGVRLSIDPALVPDPDDLVRRISAALGSPTATKKES